MKLIAGSILVGFNLLAVVFGHIKARNGVKREKVLGVKRKWKRIKSAIKTKVAAI